MYNLNNKTGVMNVAPVKLSGNYKIVVTDDLKLFLDDYNGRRVEVDMLQEYLPQVANFLSTQTNISDLASLQYGGFNHGTQKVYHTPLYIDNELPKYFALNRVGNKFETIAQPIDLYNTANLIKLVDLEKIGLHKIFREIITMFEHPLSFNLDDEYVDAVGYGITELCKINNRFSIINNMANQPYIDVFNNQLMNSFVDRKMFYPRFVNLEFEFVDETNKFDFHNYFGFIADAVIVNDETEIDTSNINFRLFDYRDKIVYEQTGKWLDSLEYDDLLFTKYVMKPTTKEARVRYLVNNISAGDYMEIYHPDGSLYYTYIVSPDDIRFSLRESLSTICKRATRQSNNQFLFELIVTSITHQNQKVERYHLYIINQIDHDIAEEYTLKHSKVFQPTDEDAFRSVQLTDVIIASNVDADNIKIVDTKYHINDKFILDGVIYLRLDAEPIFPAGITNSVAEFFETKHTTINYVKPIPYLSVNDELHTLAQYDKFSYMRELTKLFVDGNTGTDDESLERKRVAKEAISKFGEINNFFDQLPFVHDVLDPNAIIEGTTNTHQTDKVIQDTSVNHDNIRNMMFKSTGQTAYITPNIMNIEKKFWNNNGNLDYLLVDKDPIKYHWFLIKSATPEYLKDDVRSLRYFTDKPKLTSKVINVGQHCETLFLGVKYRLHKKYAGYDFCVYLAFNDELKTETSYHIEIDNKTIMVVVDKYLDFVDLIRGGNPSNKPLLDLSFFYCVNEPHNTLSNNLVSFKTGGILICDDKIPVMFEQLNTTNWRHKHTNGKWYICLKRSASVITDKFTELFPEENDAEFYIYSTIELEGTQYNYLSIKITMLDIYLLNDDYVWCEDLQIEFFDLKRLVLNTNVPTDELFRVLNDDIIDVKPAPKDPSKPYVHYNATIDVMLTSGKQTFKILNTEQAFSIKQYYFEVSVMNEFIGNQTKTTKSVFTFPEFISTQPTFDAISTLFDIQWDYQTHYEMFSLFDRNQLWLLLKSLLANRVNFKHNTPEQTRKIINDLLVNNLSEFSKLKLLPIKNSVDMYDKYLKLEVVDNDVNGVIWPHYSDIGSAKPVSKIFKINRIRAPYSPHLRSVKDELEFQNDRQSIDKPLITVFDNKNNTFGTLEQVEGNIVSSLFAKTSDIVIVTDHTDDGLYDIERLLIDSIDINDMVNSNDRDEFQQILEENINNQIQYSYVDELLNKFYYLDTVYNNLNMRIEFEYIENSKVIKLRDSNNNNLFLGENPKTQLIFKRK